MHLRVSDTGAGIKAEELPHLFARTPATEVPARAYLAEAAYWIADQTNAGEKRSEAADDGSQKGEEIEGGLGIGLALAAQLVQLHGGTVNAHGDGPGRGSEFVVKLPAAT